MSDAGDCPEVGAEHDDGLATLREQLAELDEAPLSAHPDVLERTHRALVEELEALAHLDEGGTPR